MKIECCTLAEDNPPVQDVVKHLETANVFMENALTDNQGCTVLVQCENAHDTPATSNIALTASRPLVNSSTMANWFAWVRVTSTLSPERLRECAMEPPPVPGYPPILLLPALVSREWNTTSKWNTTKKLAACERRALGRCYLRRVRDDK